MKILIVDDSIEKAKVIQKILKKNLPYESTIVDSAESAFQLLELRDPTYTDYKIILMDIIMPGLNGIEATRLLKESEKFKDIPVLMITGSNDEETIDSSFKAGAMDYINTTPVRELELLARVNSAIRYYNEMERLKKREIELIEKTKILNKTNKFLEKISIHDPLTNLYNRRYLNQCLEMEWDKLSHSINDLCILMIDVDHFKLFNDHYGHLAGDEALRKVADTLKMSAKRGRDIVARYGGEEFCIVLPDTASEGALLVAQKILHLIKVIGIPHIFSPHDRLLTCSIGLSSVSSHSSIGINIDELISRSDKALYKAKENGRNRVEVYEQ